MNDGTYMEALHWLEMSQYYNGDWHPWGTAYTGDLQYNYKPIFADTLISPITLSGTPGHSPNAGDEIILISH